MPIEITLRASDVAAALERHPSDRGYALLTTRAAPVYRAMVVLQGKPSPILIAYDLAVGDAAWVIRDLDGAVAREDRYSGMLGGRAADGVVIDPERSIVQAAGATVSVRWPKPRAEPYFLNVLQFTADPAPVTRLSTLGVSGVRITGWAVLFPTATSAARSVFFDVEGGGALRFLIAGLAPGTWEIWRNGFLEDPQGVVERSDSVLYFQAPAGNYWLKRLF